MKIQTEADEKVHLEEIKTKLCRASSVLITRAMHRSDLTCTGEPCPFVAHGVQG